MHYDGLSQVVSADTSSAGSTVPYVLDPSGQRVALHYWVSGFDNAQYLVTTFDVVHDAVDPRGMLRAIREALRSDGVYVCLDINCSDRLEENVGPKGALFHGFSILLCMTMSLAAHGEGLGTLGLHPAKLEELCAEAGFGEVRQVPIENPFNNLYEIRP